MLNKISVIKLGALNWSELCNLSQNGICKPATNDKSSEYEIQTFLINDRKIELPDFSTHSQNVKRAVKLKSEASHAVYLI